MSIKFRLTVMSFLQFFVWGAWLITIATYFFGKNMGTGVQFGAIFSKKRFAVDVFTGIGARFIHTDISDIQNPVRSRITKAAEGPSFTASYSYKGNVSMLQVNVGIRLIWHFYDFRHPRK